MSDDRSPPGTPTGPPPQGHDAGAPDCGRRGRRGPTRPPGPVLLARIAILISYSGASGDRRQGKKLVAGKKVFSAPGARTGACRASAPVGSTAWEHRGFGKKFCLDPARGVTSAGQSCEAPAGGEPAAVGAARRDTRQRRGAAVTAVSSAKTETSEDTVGISAGKMTCSPWKTKPEQACSRVPHVSRSLRDVGICRSAGACPERSRRHCQRIGADVITRRSGGRIVPCPALTRP